MDYHYVLYVDEAGDDKVDRLKPQHENGNSEWLCLGGYLIQRKYEHEMESRRDSILKALRRPAGQTIHFKNLKPRTRDLVATELAKYPARGFVVCSMKKTFQGHHNPKAAAKSTGNPNDLLYNFVTNLLLERVTQFVGRHAASSAISDPKLKIVMASRKGHHFGRFKAYIQQKKGKPLLAPLSLTPMSLILTC